MRQLLSIRQILTYVAVLLLLALADPQPLTFGIGAGLALAGLAIRVWACGHLRKNQEVVTSGPYAFVKNPLYVGTFLIAAGGLLAAGSPRMPAVLLWTVLGPAFLLVFFGYYMPKKRRVEGERLTKYFGPAYARYAEAVPDFVPKLRPYAERVPQPWRRIVFLDNHEFGLDLLILSLFALMPLVAGWVRTS